jgi:hypothetical protein
MTQANQADFFTGGTFQSTASNVKRPKERATTPDGLYYLDTGEPTPLLIRRQQLNRGELTGDLKRQAEEADARSSFSPSDARNTDDYAFDNAKGLYYIKGSSPRVYITNDPARNQVAEETPTFTANAAPSTTADYTNVMRNAGALALAGASAGPVGAAAGGVLGALSGLPSATGKGIYLTAGDPSQMPAGQRVGTATEAAQANANYAATGNSGALAPGAAGAAAGGYRPLATYTPTMGTTGGGALSGEAQRILQQAGQFATQNQAAADRSGAAATAAAIRAAPQITAPSSANQQAVYDQAMGFQAQSGADAIRSATADTSGANQLDAFRPTNSEQGVSSLYGYSPDATLRSAAQLADFQATNTAAGANAVAGFSPSQVQGDAQSLRTFEADRSGIDRLNTYAGEPEGPSQAQALLRAQADADKRTMLAIARSGRGGPGAVVNAQRQAITEGGLIAAETRGQAAALRAQETDQYKQRQLAALAQAGSLISQAEAQRLQGLAQAGALMSQADQQKLAALEAYGQLKATQDAQQLSARQSAGQLNASADTNRLGATQSAAAIQSQMDAQRLSATTSAANIRLSGSEINQRGAIAASSANLQAQALNLQSLSLAGNISTEIRNQDINVLRANLDASLQNLALNDQQVRFFSQMRNDREVASQNLQMQASALGIDANKAQQALDMQWQQLMASQMNQQQQMQYQYDVLNSGNAQAAQGLAMQQQQIGYNQNRQDRNDLFQGLGSAFTALSTLFPASSGGNATVAANSSANKAAGYMPTDLAGNPTGLPTGTNPMGMVFDPFTNQWVYPSAA